MLEADNTEIALDNFCAVPPKWIDLTQAVWGTQQPHGQVFRLAAHRAPRPAIHSFRKRHEKRCRFKHFDPLAAALARCDS
jgi:hypothetical protein